MTFYAFPLPCGRGSEGPEDADNGDTAGSANPFI
jgi:hypothetical protein